MISLINAPTVTPTATATNSPTGTNTPTSTITPTSTNTPTSTSTPCTVSAFFTETFESGTLGNSHRACLPAYRVTAVGCPLTDTAHSGIRSAFAPDRGNTSDQRLTTSSPITVPTSYDQVYLDFWHNYNMEATYDGGVLEFSTDGGATFTDTLALTTFLQGGYNSTISPDFSNPLAGRSAWSGSNGGWTEVKVNLQPLAGHSITVPLQGGYGRSGSYERVAYR